MPLWRYAGIYLLVVGVIHTIFGLIMGRGHLRGMVADGFFCAVESTAERSEFFWFMLTGCFLLILGYAVHWIGWVKRMRPPRTLGWLILIVAAIGMVAIPMSGFVLFVPVALVLAWGRE